VKDEIGDLFADSCNTTFLLFSVIECSKCQMQIEVHTVGFAIPKMRKYKSPHSDQIPAKLFQVGRETLQSTIHKPVETSHKTPGVKSWTGYLGTKQ
jgi:hypothetical protein